MDYLQWCEACKRNVPSITTIARVTQRERLVGLIKVCPRCARTLLKARVIDVAPKYLLRYADYIVVVHPTREPRRLYTIDLTATQAKALRVRGFKLWRTR